MLIVACGRAGSTVRRRPPPTAAGLVRGGRIAAIGTIESVTPGGALAELRIERVLCSRAPAHPVRAGEIIHLYLDRQVTWDVRPQMRAIWILERPDGGFSFIGVSEMSEVLTLLVAEGALKGPEPEPWNPLAGIAIGAATGLALGLRRFLGGKVRRRSS